MWKRILGAIADAWIDALTPRLHYHSCSQNARALRYVVGHGSLLSKLYPSWHWCIRLGCFELYSDADAIEDPEALRMSPGLRTRSAWVFGLALPLAYAMADVVEMAPRRVPGNEKKG